MANPRKPAALKLIAGTQRADRDTPTVSLPLVNTPPPPPEWLPNSHAVNEWHRLAGILQANNLLTQASLSALAQLCAVHGKVVASYIDGDGPNAAMLAQLRGLINDFGLTPVAQSKLPVAETRPTTDNPFLALGRAGRGS